jgi:hypothetical protein
MFHLLSNNSSFSSAIKIYVTYSNDVILQILHQITFSGGSYVGLWVLVEKIIIKHATNNGRFNTVG